MRVEQELAMASFGMTLDESWFVRAWAGGVLGGTLYDSPHSGLSGPQYGTHTITGGWLLSAQLTRRLRAQDGWLPFVQGTFTVGWSQMRITPAAGQPDAGRKDGFLGTDLRVSAIAGWTIADLWTPYVSARAFAAPFFWQEGEGWYTSDPYKSGQDVDHFQVGVGSTFKVPGGFAVFVDYAALGEQALTAGIAYGWTNSMGAVAPAVPGR